MFSQVVGSLGLQRSKSNERLPYMRRSTSIPMQHDTRTPNQRRRELEPRARFSASPPR
jgi:hypothetical protein